MKRWDRDRARVAVEKAVSGVRAVLLLVVVVVVVKEGGGMEKECM